MTPLLHAGCGCWICPRFVVVRRTFLKSKYLPFRSLISVPNPKSSAQGTLSKTFPLSPSTLHCRLTYPVISVRPFCQMSSFHNSNPANKRSAKPAASSGPSKVPRNASHSVHSTHLSSLGGGESVDQMSIGEESNANKDVPEMDGLEILDAPIKSHSDKKSYRTIRLANGLKALLISDPTPIEEKSAQDAKAAADDLEEESSDEEEDDDEEDDDDDDDDEKEEKEKLAACSLCIDVGSFSDPRDIQGLSHFLEHMIFMGSEKYPSENEFDQYIKKCGGSDNAHTNCEETQFYFEVGEEHLDGAFDRFANLFKHPLMLKEAMTRERDAVESEFTSKRQDTGVRREQLLASMGRPQHPSSIFTWGNAKTLKENIDDEQLYDRVHEYRRRHYSAHRMYLCVQARLGLDVLQELVVKHWSDMPNNGKPGDDFSEFNHLNAFNEEFSSKLLLMKPVANITKLEVTFCLPPMLKHFESKPHHFVAYLLGNEGTGSLCAYLRNKLYIMDLVAGVEDVGFDSNSLYAMFSLNVYLTQRGFDNVGDVLAAVFGYIRLLRDAGPLERLYREIQVIEENNFRFKTDQTPAENVEELAINLKYYPSKCLFTADSLYSEYDPETIGQILESLTDPACPMNILLTSRQPFSGHKFDRVEPWFGTEYATVDYPAGWKELRSNAPVLDEFTLPPPNPYITSDFNILYLKDVTKVTKYPVKVYDSPTGELWFRQDDRFLLPIAYYYFYLTSPVFRGTKDNCANAALFPSLLKFKLIENLYPATIAGLGYECYTSDKGLVIRISGYSQNLHRIVEALGEMLTTFADDVTEEQFRTFVEQQLRNYYNVIIKPKAFAKVLRFGIIEHQFVPTLDKFEHLKTITLEDFRLYAKKFVSKMRIQALFQGNLTAQQASSIMTNLVDSIKCSPLDDPDRLELRTHRIPSGTKYLRCRSLNEFDANTVTVNYYQFGRISIRLNCLLDMLLLVVEEPAFDQLRSKEQLGYDVGCCVRDNFGILGYTISVVSQENKFTSEHIDERIEAFREEFAQIMLKLSADEFEQFRQTLIKLKMTDDNHLRDELTRNWAEVTTDEFIFDRHLQEVECIKTMDQKDFKEFYLNHFYKKTRKLSVQVIGNADVSAEMGKFEVEPESIFAQTFAPLTFVDIAGGEKRGEVIRDVDAFVQSLVVYPLSKTVADDNDDNGWLSDSVY